MAKLTDDQLAKRAATMRNNRLRKKMPLFANLMTENGLMSDWLTTPEEQKERIQRQHAEFQKIWKRWGEQDAEFKKSGDERRAIVAQYAETEAMIAMDAHFLKWFSNCSPAFWADYWWGKLVEYAPEVAQTQCPNAYMHETFCRWHDNCPTCGKPLPAYVPEPEPEPGLKQLTLQESILV